jgi:ABC-type glycerol-3-phosphate transport system permease component
MSLEELEQAALIDGCTPFQAFRAIVLPLIGCFQK